jgi:hypothetical protein
MAIDIVIQGDYRDRDIKRAQHDLDLLKNQSGMTGAAFTRMAGFAAGMGAAVGTAAIQAVAAGAQMAVTFGVDGVKAFLDDEAAAARLAKTMENLGLAQATSAVEANIDALQRQTGVADDLLRPAFDRLVRSVGSVDEANKLLALSLDVAGGTSRSLDSVVQALGKAFDGNTGGLSRLGAGLDKATLKTGDMDVITKQLADTFGGQAAVKAGTYQGQIDRVSVAFGELQESFGKAFMEGVTSGFSDGTDAGDALTQTLNDLTPAIQDIGTQLGNIVAGTPKFVEFIKGMLDDFAVLRDQVLLVVAAFIAFKQVTKDRDIEGAQKTLADANAALAASMDARTEAYTKAFASETGLKTATSATVSAALAAGTAQGSLASQVSGTVGAALAAGKAMGALAKVTDDGAGSVGGTAASATPKVYKYAEAIKAAQKATDDGVKSFNDYAASASESIMKLLSIDDAATLFEERNSQVKTALKDLVDYQATLSAEQTDAEKKKVAELQAIYQAAQTQAAEGGASIVDTFVQQAQRVSEFGTKMRQLLAAGLNETSFKEISAMNLENGMKVADAFLDGNIQENIRRTNEAVGSVKSIADQVGIDAAKQFATAGIQMAVSMIEALLEVIGSKGKGRKALLSMMDDLAAAMNRTSYINVVTTSSGQGGVSPGVTPTMSPVEASNLADFLAGGIGSPEGGFFPGFANGGPVLGGRPIIVGEKGPELFVPGSNGNVVPNNAMGGNTYQINVNAGVGDPRAIGQQIVEYVKKFEQANGPVFRAA